jgi:serine protease AprX
VRTAKRWTIAIAIALVFSATIPAISDAKSTSKIDPALLRDATLNPNKEFRVIVQGAARPGEQGQKGQNGNNGNNGKNGKQGQKGQQGEHADRAGSAVQRAGGEAKNALPIAGAASAKITGRKLVALARDPDVSYISLDAVLRSKFDPATGAGLVTEPGIIETNAPLVWSQLGLTGQGIGVAVIDSGVASHPDLAGRIVAAIDFTTANPIVSTTPLGDPGGHGTHVAGLVAGDGSASGGAYTGVAPRANIIDIRVIDANGYSNVSTLLRAMQWVLANRATYNIRVVNLSLGAAPMASYKLDPLATASEILTFANVAVVTAAGNTGPDAGTITSPGYDPYVITVGAVDDNGTPLPADDTVATFSSRGPTAFDFAAKPDLVAPGRKMVSLRSPGSTLDGMFPERQVTALGATSADYFRLSGTSMAAPVVAGVVALMLERNPTLNPEQVKHRLKETAVPMVSAPFSSGSGMVDAMAAVTNIDPALEYSVFRVTDQFATDMLTYLQGQPLVWRDLTFNGGLDPAGRPWATVTWGNISWESITWENISWEAFTWANVSWEAVSSLSVSWETAEALSMGSLGSRGAGWDPLD